MLYLGQLFLKWNLAYPTSALVVDVVAGVAFLGAIIYLAWSAHQDKITKQ